MHWNVDFHRGIPTLVAYMVAAFLNGEGENAVTDMSLAVPITADKRTYTFPLFLLSPAPDNDILSYCALILLS